MKSRSLNKKKKKYIRYLGYVNKTKKSVKSICRQNPQSLSCQPNNFQKGT